MLFESFSIRWTQGWAKNDTTGEQLIMFRNDLAVGFTYLGNLSWSLRYEYLGEVFTFLLRVRADRISVEISARSSVGLPVVNMTYSAPAVRPFFQYGPFVPTLLDGWEWVVPADPMTFTLFSY